MEQLSLLDKFKVLFDNIFEHPLFIVLLLVPAIIYLLQKKHGKKAFVVVYLLVIIFVLYIGGEVIFELFDNLMNGLFMTLYFPNFITLFVVVVACSIIALFSFFSKKMFKINKIINITGFAIIQMLFVLTLTAVRSNNINIYADNALYSNSDVLTLMQLLIGTFTLQVVAIFIINGINKVTDILDKRSTPLGQDISEEINHLEKTKRNNLNLIKNIKIDNTKVGYINVADKANTSKPKLKPFTFDVEKLESITLNVPEEVSFTKMFGPTILEDDKTTDDKLIVSLDSSSLRKRFDKALKNVKNSLENKTFTKKKILLPKEKSEPIILPKKKPNLLKPMNEIDTSLENNLKKKDKVRIISGKAVKPVRKFVVEKKPDLMRSDEVYDSSIKVMGEVSRPKLVRKKSSVSRKSVDLVDNLNILDIQSTLDTVVKFTLMKGVNLKVISNDVVAVENLKIPDFNKLIQVFEHFKLYKKV